MKILVTGCAGFIGFHLTRRLLSDGHEVTGVDDLNDYYDPRLKAARLAELGIMQLTGEYGKSYGDVSGKMQFIHSAVEDRQLYENHLNGSGFDVVCHLAAQAGVRYSIENPARYISSNVDGFFLILEYCRHHIPKKLVYASSSSVYGNSAQVPYREEDRTDSPVSLYAATKKASEAMAYSYASLYGIKSVGLRFFTVYGPWGRPDMAPFIFTKSILSGEPVKVFNGGKLSRDFTYIDDVIEGIVRVLINEPANQQARLANHGIYNIGNSHPVELESFISEIEDISGRKAILCELPMQPGDVLTTWADTSRLELDYGYRPSTPLREGLKSFIGWYKDFYKI